MLDLTSIEIADVTESQLYSLLVVFNESIRLKRNVIYTYQLTRPVDPTIEEPNPSPEIINVYFYINKPFIDLSINELETAIVSTQVSEYGFTGPRLDIVTRPFKVLSGAPETSVNFTSDFKNIFNKDKYDYLRSVKVSDLSYAKDIFYSIGKKYNWPSVSNNQAAAIVNAIAEYEDDIDSIEHDSELEIILNSLKVSITRLFDPYIVPDEIE